MTEITWTNVTVTLGELVPWDHNPKGITEGNARRLLDYWKKIGQFQTIAIGPNNEVYDGHQRLTVLLAAFGPTYEIDARQSSRLLTEQERKELVIAAHAGTTGHWDWKALKEWDAVKLRDWGFDKQLLEQLTKDAAHLSKMLDSQEGQEAPEPREDEAEALREKWGVEVGQLWQLGDHLVVCGDATDPAVVERVLIEKPFMMATDPPYGIEVDHTWRDTAVKSKWAGEPNVVMHDDQSDWREAYALCDADVAYVWCSSAWSHVVRAGLIAVDYDLRQQVVWAKDDFALSRQAYHWQHELCWYGVREGRSTRWCGSRKQPTVWQAKSPKQIMGRTKDAEQKWPHPTPKPLKLIERQISNHGAPGDAVYDPFLGSGTTLIACETQRRVCRAADIEPKYVAITLERWHQLTNRDPVLKEGP